MAGAENLKRMSDVSSDSLQTFFTDLRAAVQAGVKLEIGDGETPAGALSVKKLNRIEQDVESGNALPKRMQASIETWQKTGSMVPVLEGLSSRLSAWRRIRKLFRRSLIYLFCIAALSIAALIWYQLSILPEIKAIRQDLIQLARPVAEIEPSSIGFWANVTLILFALCVLLGIWWLIKGGAVRAGWWLGADNYMRYRTLATASRTVQALVAAGEDPESATSLGGTLVGLRPDESGELLASVRDLDRQAILSSEWSDYLLMMAQQQYISARIWGPTSVIVIIGGIFTLLFVLLAWWPITILVHELSHSTKV